MLSGQRLAEVGQILTGLMEPQKRALLDFVRDATEEAVLNALDLQAPVENRERLAGAAGVLKLLHRDLKELTNGDYVERKEVAEWRKTRQTERGFTDDDKGDEEDPAMLTR